MKFASLFLALIFGATVFVAPLSIAAASDDAPVLLAQGGPLPKRDNAVTSINDRGASEAPRPKATPAADDTFAIHSTTKPTDPGLILWDLVKKGGWAMIPLGILSVITLMLIIMFLFTMRRGAILTPEYMNTADVLLKKRDYVGLLAISSRHSEVVARIVQRSLDFATKNPSATLEGLREIAEAEGGGQAAALQYRVNFLADIGVISPMIGLLGTVSGIISAFAKLGSGDATISRDILLASGVSEALVATFSGLVLGITAMGFYALFRNKVQSLISDMEIATTHLMGLLTISFGKKREAASRLAIEDGF